MTQDNRPGLALPCSGLGASDATFGASASSEYLYQAKLDAAKAWLGDHYLLAHPVGRGHNLSVLLRKQAE